MGFNTFTLSEKINIERFEEGSLIVNDEEQVVVCLGKFETSILDLLLIKGRENSINLLKQQYRGQRIEADINEFCDKLINQKIIIGQ